MHNTIEDVRMNHEEIAVETKIALVTDTGLGFGEGSISTKAQMEKGTLTQEALAVAHEVLTERADEVFTKIDPSIKDDGCGDGRPTADTFVLDDEGNEIHFNKSYPRAKLFGGGLIVASSMWRIMNGQPNDGETVLADRKHVAGILKAKGIEYGAHSDEHAHGDSCGCGAIDKYPQVSGSILAYEEQIRAVLAGSVYGNDHEAALPAIDAVFARYKALAWSEDYLADAAGKDTMDLIAKDGAVIKKLGGEHEEDIFVLNDIEGTTFEQPAFDKIMKENDISVPVQVFVVDIWRGRMYVDAMAEAVLESGAAVEDIDTLKQIAYADFLIRTLAVTATLTAGDLPGYARMKANQENFALGA